MKLDGASGGSPQDEGQEDENHRLVTEEMVPQIIREKRTSLLAFAERFDADADDFFQEVCMKFVEKVREGEVFDLNPGAYLYLAAFNHQTQFRRRRQRRRHTSLEGNNEACCARPSPEKTTMLRRELATVQAVASGLSAFDRVVLEGLARDETRADTCGELEEAGFPAKDCTPSRVDQRRNRIRQQLRPDDDG